MQIFFIITFFVSAECWNQVWEWHEIVPAVLMAQLLEKFFFPKWMQTLVIWLNQSPNLDQVSRWYSGWKNQMSDVVLQQPGIKGTFGLQKILKNEKFVELPPHPWRGGSMFL